MKKLFAMRLKLFFSLAALIVFGFQTDAATNVVVLNDDAGWCWYEDERVIVADGKLIVGTVANGSIDKDRHGDIDVVSYDLESGKIQRSTLHKNLQADDHDSPAFLVRPDGRILSMYCKHGGENKIYYRISVRPFDATDWQEEKTFVPSESSRVTYSNLHWLKKENGGKGRIYDFFRGLNGSFKPSWMFSDNLGETWKTGQVLIDFPGTVKHRPYVKYASNGKDTVHFVFTEGHPRNFDNSIYHAFYRDGWIHDSAGKKIKKMEDGPILPSKATRIFAGDSNNVAWTQDIALDSKGRPRIVFSVQKDSAGLPSGIAGMDHRYHFARWNGKRWLDAEIAFAGSRLYAGEDDYTGGICLHPDDENTVFISTNVDPVSGAKSASGHYEIFQGNTRDGGKTWKWVAITKDSTVDNLRPIVPHWSRGKTALLWLRGTFSTYTKYQLQAVLKIEE